MSRKHQNTLWVWLKVKHKAPNRWRSSLCNRQNDVNAEWWDFVGQHDINVRLQTKPQDQCCNCKITTGDKPRLKIESKNRGKWWWGDPSCTIVKKPPTLSDQMIGHQDNCTQKKYSIYIFLRHTKARNTWSIIQQVVNDQEEHVWLVHENILSGRQYVMVIPQEYFCVHVRVHMSTQWPVETRQTKQPGGVWMWSTLHALQRLWENIWINRTGSQQNTLTLTHSSPQLCVYVWVSVWQTELRRSQTAPHQGNPQCESTGCLLLPSIHQSVS